MRKLLPAVYGRQADNIFALYAYDKGITVEQARDTETDEILDWFMHTPIFKRIEAFFRLPFCWLHPCNAYTVRISTRLCLGTRNAVRR